MFNRSIFATILSGTLATASVIQAQWSTQGPRYQPRYSRPYEYDRPYESPRYYGQDVYHPAERDWNDAMRRFRIERDYRGPYRR